MRFSPRHARRRRRLVATPAAVRAQALLALLAINIGVAVATNDTRPVRSNAELESAAVLPAPASSDPVRVGVIAPSPAPSPARVRKSTPSVAPRPGSSRADRGTGRSWIPSGTGMWTYLWNRTEGGDARKIVAKAKRTGLTHLYVRTGTRRGGFDGGPMLRELLPATKGTGIKVIAWDFPILSDPKGEARRLAAAARFRAPGKGTPRIAAVAPDIETPAEGTRLTGHGVYTYLRELRRLLPPDVPIFGVIPWPSEKRLGKFPYHIVGPNVDAIVPMAYWINRDPTVVTRQTMQRLRRYGKPVMPVGQAYDPRIDVPSLKLGPPSRADVDAFLATARKEGAPSASLWVWQFAKGQHWGALSAARHAFDDVRVPVRR